MLNKFYLDKEKDIIVKLFKSNNDEITYILETPNHNTGNLITNLAKICNLETIKNKIQDAKLKLKVVLASTEDAKGTTTYYSAKKFKFFVDIENISNEDLKNVDIEVNLPECLEYDIESFSYENDGLERVEENIVNGKKIIFKLPSLKVGEKNEIYLITKIKSLDVGFEMGDPIDLQLRDYELCLRKEDLTKIEVEVIK